MAYLVGDTVTFGFSTGSAGESFTFNLSRNPSGDTFLSSSNVTSLGGGDFLLTFAPTVAGNYYARFTGVTSGEEIVLNIDVDAAESVTVIGASASGALTRTRLQLVQDLAREFGDLLQLTSTTNSTTSRFIDSRNISTGADGLEGRQIYGTSGSNIGLASRITSTTEASNYCDFTPAWTATTAAGDTADVYNRWGSGFLVAEYRAAIEKAIVFSAGLGLIHVTGSGGTFDAETPAVTVPAALTEVYRVMYTDANDNLQEVRRANRFNGDGWYHDPANGALYITGFPAWNANGSALTLYGYGRQGALTADSDTCAVDPHWLIAYAKLHLATGNLHRRPDLAQVIPLWREEEQESRARLRVIRGPVSQGVRA